MRLALMTPLALPFATAMTSGETATQHNPEMVSWGTEKNLLFNLADVAVGGDMEDQPSYCALSPPNPTCYRNEYPACCYDPAEDCPEQRPPCECDGDCVACSYDNVGHSDDGTCGPDQFCMVSKGECRKRIATIAGTCASKPEMCTYENNPVCGCDGKTYGNPCMAQGAGASVMHVGACRKDNRRPERSGCRYDNVGHSDHAGCGPDEVCRISKGECRKRIATIAGTCASKPKMCTSDNNPVCGCDGTTYGNACMAKGAGASVKHSGECRNDDGRTELPGSDNIKVNEKNSPEMPGSDYCTWAPDNDCYVNGWPQCCVDDDQPCPPDPPRCDNHSNDGWDYCTWSPEESCYESGWPKCCERFDGTNCPTDKPNCDVDESGEDSLKVKFLRNGR